MGPVADQVSERGSKTSAEGPGWPTLPPATSARPSVKGSATAPDPYSGDNIDGPDTAESAVDAEALATGASVMAKGAKTSVSMNTARRMGSVCNWRRRGYRKGDVLRPLKNPPRPSPPAFDRLIVSQTPFQRTIEFISDRRLRGCNSISST
jgi:hypothetical protein